MPKRSEEPKKAVRGKSNGWAEYARIRKEKEAKEKQREEMGERIWNFWLRPGESAVIQFLHDDPYIFDAHSIQVRRGGEKRWQTEPCQLLSQRYCVMCKDGSKAVSKAGFKILDYRGNWDKDKEDFDNKPVERLWIVSMTVLGQIAAKKEKSGKDLTELVLEVSRTGAGKNDTAYSFETALDEDDRKLKPIEWDSETADIDELLQPKTDDDLMDLGYEVPSDDDEDEPRKKFKKRR